MLLYLALMLALVFGGADLAADRRERRHPPVERADVGGRGPAFRASGGLRSRRRDPGARDADRPHRRLAAGGGAVQPGDVRLQPGDPRRLPLAVCGGAVRGAAARPQPALRACGALAVPVVPTASRYVAGGEQRRLRELALRGTRYTLALFVPLCVTLMALAEPILDVWLGDRYGDGGAALAILVSYWVLLGGARGDARVPGRRRPGTLRRPGVRGHRGAQPRLTLVLTPELGLEGPALGTAIPFVLCLPAAAARGAARLRCLARRAGAAGVATTYALGAATRRRAGSGAAGARRRSRCRWSSGWPPGACSPIGSPSTRWCCPRAERGFARGFVSRSG